MRSLLTLLLVLGLAPAAEASTLPPLDGGPGHVTAALGLIDASVDVGIGTRASLGATAFIPPLGFVGLMGAAGRATFWLTDPQAWWVVGLTVSAGDTYSSGSATSTQYLWAQPALNLALAPGRTGFALRATVGPVASYTNDLPRAGAPAAHGGFEVLPFVPNVELAYRFSPSNELTFGGNGLVGWRFRL